jgi:flagellar basal-body rod modification protein FlgD
MASIGTLFPTTSSQTSANSATNSSANSSSSSNDGTNALANQDTFLQLLVAQLQHQDPTQPMQGTEFVTQLAEFSNLQQSVASRQDLDGIYQKYTGSAPSASTNSSSTGSTSTGATVGA